jgi:Zn-dependent membrane protease YugP
VSEVFLFALSFALSIAVPALIVRWDLGRLRGERLERAWPDASMWSAVVAFNLLCLPVHFIRTRRSWAGLGLGIFWLVCAFLLIALPVEGLAAILGISD